MASSLESTARGAAAPPGGLVGPRLPSSSAAEEDEAEVGSWSSESFVECSSSEPESFRETVECGDDDDDDDAPASLASALADIGKEECAAALPATSPTRDSAGSRDGAGHNSNIDGVSGVWRGAMQNEDAGTAEMQRETKAAADEASESFQDTSSPGWIQRTSSRTVVVYVWLIALSFVLVEWLSWVASLNRRRRHLDARPAGGQEGSRVAPTPTGSPKPESAEMSSLKPDLDTALPARQDRRTPTALASPPRPRGSLAAAAISSAQPTGGAHPAAGALNALSHAWFPAAVNETQVRASHSAALRRAVAATTTAGRAFPRYGQRPTPPIGFADHGAINYPLPPTPVAGRRRGSDEGRRPRLEAEVLTHTLSPTSRASFFKSTGHAAVHASVPLPKIPGTPSSGKQHATRRRHRTRKGRKEAASSLDEEFSPRGTSTTTSFKFTEAVASQTSIWGTGLVSSLRGFGSLASRAGHDVSLRLPSALLPSARSRASSSTSSSSSFTTKHVTWAAAMVSVESLYEDSEGFSFFEDDLGAVVARADLSFLDEST